MGDDVIMQGVIVDNETIKIRVLGFEDGCVKLTIWEKRGSKIERITPAIMDEKESDKLMDFLIAMQHERDMGEKA